MSQPEHAAFNARQKVDYKELVVVEPDRAQEILAEARTFIDTVAGYVSPGT